MGFCSFNPLFLIFDTFYTLAPARLWLYFLTLHSLDYISALIQVLALNGRTGQIMGSVISLQQQVNKYSKGCLNSLDLKGKKSTVPCFMLMLDGDLASCYATSSKRPCLNPPLPLPSLSSPSVLTNQKLMAARIFLSNWYSLYVRRAWTCFFDTKDICESIFAF